jgi:hypothetical protein
MFAHMMTVLRAQRERARSEERPLVVTWPLVSKALRFVAAALVVVALAPPLFYIAGQQAWPDLGLGLSMGLIFFAVTLVASHALMAHYKTLDIDVRRLVPVLGMLPWYGILGGLFYLDSSNLSALTKTMPSADMLSHASGDLGQIVHQFGLYAHANTFTGLLLVSGALFALGISSLILSSWFRGLLRPGVVSLIGSMSLLSFTFGRMQAVLADLVRLLAAA